MVSQSYNDFIQKTKAELSKEPDSTPATKPQIKTPTSATEKPRIKPPPLQRSALTFTSPFNSLFILFFFFLSFVLITVDACLLSQARD